MFITMIHPTSSAQSATSTFEGDDSKYAVADILTSFHSTGDNSSTPLNLSTSYTPVTTTDILTPTTLANLEQTFLELQQSVAPTPHTVSLPRESGFVPPIVDPIRPSSSAAPQMVKQEYDYSVYQDDSSQDLEDEWLPPSGKRARYDDSSAMIESYVEESVPVTGRRRRKHDDNLNPEEAARRNVRRERNKVAAAKCRQRRVDLTNSLINESEGLEEEQSKLENEIQMLNQQKEQLEFLLEAHKPVCAADVLGNGSAPKTSSSMSVKAETVDITYPSVLKTATVGTSTSQSPFPVPSSSGKLSNQTSHRLMSRPNTLPIPHPKVSCRVTEATGVPITTPSSVFNIGLESMLDGHTGLTPITGAPSCASQLHRASTDGSSSPSENLSSPTTLMAL